MKSIARVVVTASLIMGLSVAILAQETTTADIKDEIEQSDKAAEAFREIMSAPDKAIPQGILDGAECVAVFPTVIKAAFGIGGRGGRGVASCRTPAGWSAPTYSISEVAVSASRLALKQPTSCCSS